MTGETALLDPDRARRGLGRRPRLRLAGVALWSAFLGAIASIMTLFLLPEDWTLPPTTPAGSAWTFFALWLLALVPAVFAAALATPRRED
jgi:hypothetical protein